MQAAMACPGWKHDYISGGESEFVTARAAENDTRVSGCNAENFMCGGVIVMEVVDAVSPLRWPAVANERLFEIGSRIGTGYVERPAVEEGGKEVVVGDPPIAGELNNFRVGSAGLGEQRAR